MEAEVRVFCPTLIPSKFGLIFFKILENIEYGKIIVKTPENHVFCFEGEKRGVELSLTINDWKFCQSIFLKGDIGLGEAYSLGYYDIQKISDLIIFGLDNYNSLSRVIQGSIFKILFYRLKHYLKRNTKEGSLKNIHAHYDIGNEFYKIWLDPTMTYSSALFEGDEKLESAQRQKYQRIIDTLKLKAGDRVLEIGCGWGGFMEHATAQGIHVTGVTISQEQFDYAKERLKDRSNLAEVLFKDYRDIEGQYDYIVSIEMFEALGEEYWSTYFKKLRNLLKKGGKALIQSITIKNEDFSSYRKSADFIQHFIFPGGMLPSPNIFQHKARKNGLKVLENFSFGKSYAKTLLCWDKEFVSNIEAVKKIGFDQKFIRLWRFYLHYCSGAFTQGKIDVNQFLLEGE